MPYMHRNKIALRKPNKAPNFKSFLTCCIAARTFVGGRLELSVGELSVAHDHIQTLEEQLERQGLPLSTRAEILARARRAEVIAELIYIVWQSTAGSVRSLRAWASTRLAGGRHGKHLPLRRA
jgi:hypothetical protein